MSTTHLHINSTFEISIRDAFDSGEYQAVKVSALNGGALGEYSTGSRTVYMLTAEAVDFNARTIFLQQSIESGLAYADASDQIDPLLTHVPVYIDATWTGVATEAEVTAALVAYVNALGDGGDVVPATAEAAIDALDDATASAITLATTPTPVATATITVDPGEVAGIESGLVTFS
jgi:hypothetical protein